MVVLERSVLNMLVSFMITIQSLDVYGLIDVSPQNHSNVVIPERNAGKLCIELFLFFFPPFIISLLARNPEIQKKES